MSIGLALRRLMVDEAEEMVDPSSDCVEYVLLLIGIARMSGKKRKRASNGRRIVGV